MHLKEDDLILHYYGETERDEEDRAALHLAECRTCHASYTRLQRVLAAVEAAPAPEMREGFERTIWARLEPELGRRRRGGILWFVTSPVPAVWAVAVMALVAGAFFAGRVTQPTAPPPVEQASAQLRERVLLSDLGEHLDRSQMMLIELVSSGGVSGVDLASERDRAEQLVSANRLYRQTAEATGNAALAGVLDDLEGVLIDIAASPDRWSETEVQQVRQRVENTGLLFKMRVLTSEVRERQRMAIRLRTGQSS
jgi:hypothetical protein